MKTADVSNNSGVSQDIEDFKLIAEAVAGMLVRHTRVIALVIALATYHFFGEAHKLLGILPSASLIWPGVIMLAVASASFPIIVFAEIQRRK